MQKSVWLNRNPGRREAAGQRIFELLPLDATQGPQGVLQAGGQVCSSAMRPSLLLLWLHLLKLQPRLRKYILHAPCHKQVPDCWRHLHKFSLSFHIIYSGIFPGANGNPLSIWVLSRKKDLSPALLYPAPSAGQSCSLRCGQSDHGAGFSWGKPSLKGACSCNNGENPLCERPWMQWAGKCWWLVCVITTALHSWPLPRYEAQLVCVSVGGGESCSLSGRRWVSASARTSPASEWRQRKSTCRKADFSVGRSLQTHRSSQT